MKKFRFAGLLIAAFVLTMAFASVAFAGAQDFVLVNNTGYPIYVVNVSPASSNDWQNDILGSQILGNGQYCEVTFPTNGVQYWDLQAAFEDGSSLSWYNIDLLSVAQVTLNGDGTASFQ